jgi:peptidoglycan/xylan/chitin deacetylase (PgdA/CDA1 family)
MRCVVAAVVAACIFNSNVAVAVEECPGNLHALGTSRVIVVDPAEHTRIGTMQYAETLPLNDKEVVLTFDDGPLPAYTGKVLETLADECIKATFFIVGGMARAYPEWVRKVYNAGHTLGTHSENHPRFFWRLDDARAISEIDAGIAATEAALGDPRALAPFFRFPGFGRTDEGERHLAARGIMTWGTDVTADDWKHISSTQVVARALQRLEKKGRGVLLLHDIQPSAALALPVLLRELKARGFRIVHVVPAGPARPKTLTDPEAWASRPGSPSTWPVVLASPPHVAAVLAAPSALSFGFPAVFGARVSIPAADSHGLSAVIDQSRLRQLAGRDAAAAWPALDLAIPPSPLAAALPTVSVRMTDLAGPLGSNLTTPRKVAAATRHAAAPDGRMAAAHQRPRSARIHAASGRDAEGPTRWARSLNWFH